MQADRDLTALSDPRVIPTRQIYKPRFVRNENTFHLLVILSVPEIFRQMLVTPGALKIALWSSRNKPILGSHTADRIFI